MTALKEYDRLEASGLWRAAPEDQRREVIVSLGDATLTMSDLNGQALTHWSIAAVEKGKASGDGALYHPDGDPGETLEIAANETAMIAGIDRVLRAIEKRRPKPGKLRLMLGLGTAAVLAAAAWFWLPDALESYTVKIVPAVKRAEIGEALLARMARVSGAPCLNYEALAPLKTLSRRILGPGREDALVVLPAGVAVSAHLPGGIVLLNRAVIEDHEDPAVAAGHVIAEAVRASEKDPLEDLLDHAGLVASLKLVTTGVVPDEALDAYAEHMLTRAPAEPDTEALLAGFARAELSSTPYAYARDITGESVLGLIEADPHAQSGGRDVLSDGDWVRLQGVCGA